MTSVREKMRSSGVIRLPPDGADWPEQETGTKAQGACWLGPGAGWLGPGTGAGAGAVCCPERLPKALRRMSQWVMVVWKPE